ncbi:MULTISPECIES: hypothetical protein [unclassified Methanoregula]|uniref:hypothetical protein n=1 Tax=unclassified Methanoregula TaxID=2649730 RepID=UPI0025E818E9|nr:MULTISPECIES: hypothetical protein [unclassified Methanoregula]
MKQPGCPVLFLSAGVGCGFHHRGLKKEEWCFACSMLHRIIVQIIIPEVSMAGNSKGVTGR